MAKEEYETPLIDAYNRLHRDPLREDGSWFSDFLPGDVALEELGEAMERELIAVYSEAERDAERYFAERVQQRFKEALEARKEVDYDEYMPQKPEPLAWGGLPSEHQVELTKIFSDCQASQFNKRTIRKRFRAYLEQVGILTTDDSG